MMKADAKTEAEVMAVLDKFNENYVRRDIDGLMALFAPDDYQILYGTGLDEKSIGLSAIRYQAERDWSQTDALGFTFKWHQVSTAGPVAWIAADGLGQGEVSGQTIQFPFRMTAVLERRDGAWYMVQSHISVPSAVQEEGDSVPV